MYNLINGGIMKTIKKLIVEIKLILIFIWEDFEYRVSSDEEREQMMKKKKESLNKG